MTARRYCLSMLAFNAILFSSDSRCWRRKPGCRSTPTARRRRLSLDGLQHRLFVPDQHELAALFRRGTPVVLSQIFVIGYKQFVPRRGAGGAAGHRRALRGDAPPGNFHVDLWRGVVYLLLPLSLILAVLLIAGGVPMTLEGAARVTTLEGGEQTIARGPVAAIVAISNWGRTAAGSSGPTRRIRWRTPTPGRTCWSASPSS